MARRPAHPLKQLKSTRFSELYAKLLTTRTLSTSARQKILTLAVLFLRHDDANVQRLGYRLLVLYSLRTEDLRPLFDTSIGLGLAPVSASVERLTMESRSDVRSVIMELSSAYLENYRSGDVYLTSDQVRLLEFCEDNIHATISVVAPTSYGKTGLVLSLLGQVDANVCVLVPTKALLAQTKKRILDAGIERLDKITTHPEMYCSSDRVVTAVLTQERLLRLLQKNPKLHFDYVFVDEAHNLLSHDERGVLLASSLLVLLKRNPNTALKFLTPFLADPENLQIKYADYSVSSFSINEYVKTERVYVADLTTDCKLELYDQFLDAFFVVKKKVPEATDSEFILKRSAKKNIIYFNTPRDLESFSASFCKNLAPIESTRLAAAAKELSQYIHKDYALIDCLSRGVVYHHGSVPDNVRLYIETLFGELGELRYLVTTSTLLEGVNLPAERMFILDVCKGRRHLSAQQMRNLVGRVCRFNDIFGPDVHGLSGLSPRIYVLKSSYMAARTNIRKFISKTMAVTAELKDVPENVLLAQTVVDEDNRPKLETAEDYVENFERGTIPEHSRRTVSSEIGRSCFGNNLREIAILEHEQEMELVLQKLRDSRRPPITTAAEVLEMLNDLFLPYLRDSDEQNNLIRFRHEATRRYYSMLLDWRVHGTSYKEMITRTVQYWNGPNTHEDGSIVFVGKWGDITRGGFQKLWTDIKKHSEKGKVNLAIVRLKEEMDFLDNVLMRFIETMNDLLLIDDDFYSRLKYGTSDARKIALIKSGLSLSLSSVLLEKYLRFTHIDLKARRVDILPDVLKEMKRNGESAILMVEAKHNIRARVTHARDA